MPTTALHDPTPTVRRVCNGGFDLWYDRRGSGRSAVVLLSGATLQATLWESVFTAPMVESGHTVIRIDWRDVGLSSRGDFRSAPYTLADLADDVVAVLDGAGFAEAHVVGFSMGGLVAQHVAILDPTRVRSLTLLASGYLGGPIMGGTPRAEAVLRVLLDRVGKAGIDPIEAEVAYWRLISGSALTYDEDRWRRRITEWIERGHNPRCPHLRIPQHEQSLDSWLADPEARAERVRRIDAPTLVVHGDDDGMFPPANGEALAADICHARLRVMEGRGHDLFLDPTGEISELVLEHVAELR